MKNRRYLATKKNGGQVPFCDDKRKLLVSVGCGKCMECKRKKGNEWKVRLKEEIRTNSLKAYFMTYTFSDQSLKSLKDVLRKQGCNLEGYDLENKICTLATRRYMERWRKKYKKSLRHWFVTEKGQTKTERIHMHGIVWTDEDKEDLDLIWGYGFADIGKKGVSEDSCAYLVKYMSKADLVHKDYKSIVLCSAGIGKGYLDRYDSNLNRFQGDKTDDRYRDRKGFKTGLPMYYRGKLWNEEEREELWMRTLDKEERWVDGIRVDVSSERGLESYKNLREIARQKSIRYGFKIDDDWEKKYYERSLKNIKKLTELKKKWNEDN